jgi:hypothetical protein
MRTLGILSCAALVLFALPAVAAEPTESLDLRRAVPNEAFLAVHGKHNPERDFQREHFREVWKTFEQSGLGERVVQLVTDYVPEHEVEHAKAVLGDLAEAVSPVDGEALLVAEEVVYGQVMQFPSSQHVLAVRLTPEAAAGAEEAVKNLMALAEEYTEGQLTVKTGEEGDTPVSALTVGEEVPFRPAVARLSEVLILSSSEQVLRSSLGRLLGGEGECKFDDPRLQQALTQLPEPEDALTFYDAQLQLAKMREIGDFIREAGEDDPNAERIGEIVDRVLAEMSIVDHEVTVEYTEGNQNRTATFGKLLPGAENKVLGEMLLRGKPFQDWQTWIPSDALAYSLNTGANLHPAYEGIMWLLEERVPEAEPFLEQFEELQAEHDVYLDRDILQAFSGENVSVSFPPAEASPLGGQDSVLALRCHKPDRIRELLHQLVDRLREIPFVEKQDLQLIESEDLEGFDTLSAAMLKLFQVAPVIGFRDGWMVVGSSPAAVEKVFATRAGEGETIVDTEAFQELDLEVEGPVHAIAYTDLAESTRQTARAIAQIGLIAPVIIGMAGQEADSEELKPVREVLGLLPSVAKIVSKFDFFEARLSVTQEGDEPATYMRRSVTVIRPLAEEEEEDAEDDPFAAASTRSAE